MPNIFKRKENGVAIMLDNRGNQIDLVHDPRLFLNINGIPVYIEKTDRSLKLTAHVPQSEPFHWDFDVVGSQVTSRSQCSIGGEAASLSELVGNVQVAHNGRW